MLFLNDQIQSCNTRQDILNLKQKTDNALIEKIKSIKSEMLKSLITASYDSVVMFTNEGEENMYNILVECYKYLVFINKNETNNFENKLNDLICNQKYVENIPGIHRLNLKSVISLPFDNHGHKYTLSVEVIIDAIIKFQTYKQLVANEEARQSHK